MASTLEPIIKTYIAGGTIAKGQCVKAGADRTKVAVASAATDKIIGIAQNAVASGDACEVAMHGGGAKGNAGGTISTGDLLTSDSAGDLIATTSANNRVVGVALEDAVDNDIFSVAVALSNV